MLRSLVLVAAGAVVGGLVSYQWTGQEDAQSEGQDRLAIAPRSESAAQAVSADTVSFDARLEVLQKVQDKVSRAELIAELEAIQSRPWSALRALEADALLMRLAEISPRAAVETALSLGMEAHLVAQAFVVWGEYSSEAALAALGSIQIPATLNAVALAMLDVVGDDAVGLERVAAALPAAAADAFRVEWLTLRARSNPYDAFQIANSMGRESLRRRALTGVASAWAAVDPRGALQQADMLSPNLAQSFRLAVTGEWARLSADDFLAYVETAPVVPEEFIVALRSVAVGDPETILRLADRVDGQMRDSLRSVAIGELAQTDFELAQSYALAMSSGQARNQALASIGGVLAREDPEEALRWAQEVAPGVRDVMTNIAINIASSDVDMALEFLDNPPPGLETNLLMSIISSRVVQEPDKAQEVASKFLRRDDLQSKAALSQLVSSWMQNEPVDALDWVLSNNAALDNRIISSAASSLASRDVESAVSYIGRIPQEHRGVWITQIAGQYGRNDPAAALGWVAQYQGESFYDQAFRQTLQAAAQTDPRSAAQQLSQASDTVQLGAASQVASAWAQQEPRAAVEWAAELSNEEARSQAVSSAVGSWANSDLDGATAWALSQPRSADRDQTLRNLVYRGMNTGHINQDLLDGFSSDTTKQQTLQPVIVDLSRSNPARARELLENEITDADVRRRIEESIEQQSGQSSGIVIRY